MRIAAIAVTLGLCARLALGCDDEPERIRCAVPQRVPLTIAFETYDGMPTHLHDATLQLVRETLEEGGIDVTYAARVTPGLPNAITMRYLPFPAFATSCIAAGLKTDPIHIRGYAHISERIAYGRASAQLLWDEQWCPASVVTKMATVTLHEIGHLLGLPHVEDLQGSDITINTPDGRWNILMQGVPTRAICDQDPMTLTPNDLPARFDPVQYRIMRDAANSGGTWQRMKDAQFDFSTYVHRFNDAIAKRTKKPADTQE